MNEADSRTVARPVVHGIPVDAMSMREVVDRVDATIRARRQCAILAVNPEKIMAAHQRPELSRALLASEVLIPDGIGVVIALRLRGVRVPERVPGSELMPALCALAAQRGYGVFLFGARDDVNALAAEKLVRQYPGLRIVGRHHGYVAECDMDGLIARINASDARILFVALGSPTQELWIERHRARLSVNALQGVGGSFDVIAGAVKRAPLVWRRLNLEWLYRLLAQPKRLLRQTAIPRFVFALAKEMLGGRSGRAPDPIAGG